MSTQQEPPYFSDARRAGHVVVDEPPKLDLEAYIANYKGRTRFERLYLMGTTSSYLFMDALRAAIAEAKRGKDVQRFEAAVSRLHDIAPRDKDASGDAAWVEKTKKQVKVETDKMEMELKGYKNNLIRESIRMGHDDLGQHYHRIGDLVKSNKIYSQMREFCTTNIHIVIMYMHIINVCIDQKAWFQAQNHIQRLRGQLGGPKNEDAEKYSAKLSAAYGLASMAQGNYAEAAREFIKTNPRMSQAKLDDLNDEEAYNEVLTPNDIAVYGGLCALASMDRDELQKNVLDSSDFRNYLELESHIRQAISHFIMGRYSECLKLLDEWKPDYLLDIYLLPHIPHIYYEIRCRAIRQYFIPYSCVTLAAIAKEFNIDEPTIEFELTQMIKRVDLNARLDRVENKLVNSSNDPRLLVHASALACAKEYERTAHTRMIKMAVNNASLDVKSPKDKGNQVSGGGGGGSQEGFGFNGVIGDMLGNQGRGMRSGRGLG